MELSSVQIVVSLTSLNLKVNEAKQKLTNQQTYHPRVFTKSLLDLFFVSIDSKLRSPAISPQKCAKVGLLN